MSLTVEKSNIANAWIASFEVDGLTAKPNERRIVLLKPTQEVQFGNRAELKVEKPLQGLGGITRKTTEGRLWYEFKFTC